MRVEVDTDKARSMNLSELSPEEIQGVLLNAAEEAANEIDEEDATLPLAAIGGQYNIGPIDVTVALGNLVLLHAIDSPFITGKVGELGEELNSMDCIKALYVLGCGKEALKPVMAVKRRIQSMMTLKKMVESKPELLDKLLDRVEEIASAETKFEEDAMDWYQASFVGYEFQEVVDGMFAALSDVVKIADDLPSEEGSGKKPAGRG